jgi:fatty-acyl-CoA synthase
MFVPLLVNDFLRKAVTQYGKKVGIVDGEKRFTYAQFGTRVNQLSNALLSLGVKKGDRVAVIDINTHRLLEMYYGVPQIGAVLLPINIRLSTKEITYILNDSEAKILFVNETMLNLVEKEELRFVESYILMRDEDRNRVATEKYEYEALLKQVSPVLENHVEIDENSPAEMFYTSGTTAKPKGMFYTHRLLWIAATKDLFGGGVDDSTIYLQAIPLFHANGWRKPHTITAVCGRHVILRQFRPEVVCDLIQREKVTFLEMVPTMADTLTSYEDLNKYDLSSLKRIAIGGASMTRATHKALIDKFPGCFVFAGYGMSETASCGTTSFLKDHLRDLPEEEKIRLAGKAGFEDAVSMVRVVNQDGKDVLPNGKEMGEIIFRGNTVIDKYWKLPDETRNTIIDGWLYSGDIAVIDENGYIEIVDRKKNIIISGGENIGSVEIEDVIRSHPAVADVAVVAAPHEKWGETPAAIVVLKESQKLDAEELTSFCRKRLAGFKIPRIIEFCDTLPKSGTGKILKAKLKEKYWQRKG